MKSSTAKQRWAHVADTLDDEREFYVVAKQGDGRMSGDPTSRIVGEIMNGIRPHHLGTDAVGRGAGWDKTNNAIAVTMALNDLKVSTGMSGGELFGALVENVIAAIQGSAAPSEWRHIGHEVAARIERRMAVR